MDLLESLGLSNQNSGACIGGHDWMQLSDTVIESQNPATGEVIAKVCQADQQAFEKIISAATQASGQWAQLPAPKRGEIIRLIGEQLRRHKDHLGSLISLEMGKSKVEGDGEVQEMIDMVDFAVGQSRMLYGNTMQSERQSHRLYEQWLPLGVVGVMTAFNFPMAVWAWNAFIAAICGNTVVWRPSSQVPLCAIAVQEICNTVLNSQGLDGIFSLFISSDHALAEKFVEDKRLSLISFTGSTETGRHVNQLVSKRLGKCLLELGGNNAVIVDESADLELAIPAIVFGAIGTAGQRCTTTRRLFVHDSLYDDVKKRLLSAYKQIQVGDPLDSHCQIGPLINAKSVQHFQQAVSEAVAEGGKVLVGGKVIERAGNYVEPTIITAENDWSVVQRETFAPILYVMKYTDINSVIELHNDVSQGLSSSLFSQNVKHCELFLSAKGSDCGIVGINVGTSGAEIGGAFGGEKDTGGGRESGSDSWKAYMRRQTVTINWGDDLPLSQGISFNL